MCFNFWRCRTGSLIILLDYTFENNKNINKVGKSASFEIDVIMKTIKKPKQICTGLWCALLKRNDSGQHMFGDSKRI